MTYPLLIVATLLVAVSILVVCDLLTIRWDNRRARRAEERLRTLGDEARADVAGQAERRRFEAWDGIGDEIENVYERRTR